MEEYKSWHEEDGITFHNQMNIFFSQCDKFKRLSLHELLRITSDTAVEEYRQRGLSRDVLTQNGYAILVSRISFKINRMPAENEHITITTWEEKPEALQFVRAYRIKDKDGNSIVEGLSSWLLVNPETRRILPLKNFTLRTAPTEQKQNECAKPGKISIPENMELLAERKILFSDMDGNGHTNNSRYGAFAMDALSEEFQAKNLTAFRLNYSKEARPGETLKIYGSFNKETNTYTVVGKTESDTSFEAVLTF